MIAIHKCSTENINQEDRSADFCQSLRTRSSKEFTFGMNMFDECSIKFRNYQRLEYYGL